MKLNIWGRVDGKKQIVKVYEADSYDLEYGTVEDVLHLLDAENIQGIMDESVQINQVLDVAKLVKECFGQVGPLLMDVFEGLTEEELRHAKLSNIVEVVKEIAQKSFNFAQNKNSKNV